VVSLSACGLVNWPVTRVDVQSFEARPPRITRDQILIQLTGVLVARGFDIKQTNKDAGLVTTEYKKIGSEGTKPPFDYYLQIRATVSGTDQTPILKLMPFVKEQNRLNAAANSDHELSYYVGEPKNVRRVSSMSDNGWRSLGQVAFMNVISDMAEKLGVPLDQFVQNVTKTDANAFNAKE
jgi:hypothetical protein